MAESVDPAPLDYRSPPRKRVRRPETPEERAARHKRGLYRLGLFIFVFAPIAFYFGPHEILFHKLGRPTPGDFDAEVQSDCVPVVRAMKEYQRDYGSLPDDGNELVPKYLPKAILFRTNVANGQFMYFTSQEQMITYDFTPGGERWEISGPFVNGVIPMPPVVLSVGSATQSATTRE